MTCHLLCHLPGSDCGTRSRRDSSQPPLRILRRGRRPPGQTPLGGSSRPWWWRRRRRPEEDWRQHGAASAGSAAAAAAAGTGTLVWLPWLAAPRPLCRRRLRTSPECYLGRQGSTPPSQWRTTWDPGKCVRRFTRITRIRTALLCAGKYANHLREIQGHLLPRRDSRRRRHRLRPPGHHRAALGEAEGAAGDARRVAGVARPGAVPAQPTPSSSHDDGIAVVSSRRRRRHPSSSAADSVAALGRHALHAQAGGALALKYRNYF